MAKFTLIPQTGTKNQTANISFKLEELVNNDGLYLKIENATTLKLVSISGSSESFVKIDKGQTSFSGTIDILRPFR